jgi:hypothetical protein
MKESIQKAKRKPVDNPVDKSVDNFIIDDIIDDMGVIINTKDICKDSVYKDKVNNNDKVTNISFDKVLTIVLTYDDVRAKMTEDDIAMLERLANAGVTESELTQALADHADKSTAALCREILLAR